MATPTIIIGIGSSGYDIIRQTQRFYFENFKRNKPDHVEYIYIETFSGDKRMSSDSDKDIVRVYTSLNQMELMIDEIKRFSDGNWLPPKEQLVDSGAGAGGIRACGRLALWGHNDEGDNFENVVTAIGNAHANVSEYTIVEDHDTRPVVFIVGTLVGGTGSGMFLDMAYLVRYLIKNVNYVFGLYLLPPKPSTFLGKEVMYANAYGALKELDLYNSVKYKYVEKWPSGVDEESILPPYDLVHFISQDYQDGRPALKELPGLIKMAGMYMFLNIAGIYSKRKERFVDGKGNCLIGKYGTFGLSAVQYPKDQIQEYIACNLSIDLLERWLDTEYIYSNSENPRRINDSEIERDIDKRWSDIIHNAFDKLNNVGGTDLMIDIEREAKKINKKEINENEYDYLRKLFSSNTSDGIYGYVKNSIAEAVNYVVDEIYDLNVQTINDSENIIYAQKVLQAIIKSINRTINFWKKFNISSDPSNWENFLRKQCKWMLSNRNKLIYEQDTTLTSRMHNTFRFMKMHLLGKKIYEIAAYIEKEDAPFKSVISGKELPKIKNLSSIYNILAEVHGKKDSKTHSLTQKLKEILREVKDTTIPILRVYSTGTFEKDQENAKNLFYQNNKNVRSRKEITNHDLWDLLKDPHELQNSLFDKLLNAFYNNVIQADVVGDYNVNEYIKKNSNKGIDMAKRANSPFISTKDIVFQQSPYLPKFVVASDENVLSNLLDNISKDPSHGFNNNDDRKLIIDELKNILVFYEEKAIPFVPLKNISYINEMKKFYEKAPDLYTSQGMTDEMWKNYRNANIPVPQPQPKRKDVKDIK